MPRLTVRTGLALVVLSAISLGAAPSLARLAYDGGSDPQTAALVRFVFGAAVAFGVMRLRGARLPMTRRIALGGLGVGVLYAVESVAYLAALELIPVAVTVLVFFTFPVFVALLVRIVDKEPVTPVKIVALVGAFAGVVLTTGAAPTALDPLGIALALLAAVGTAAYIVFGARLSRRVGSLGFAALSFAAAALVFGAWMAAAGDVNPPETALGWVGLIGGSAAFVTGILAFFTALTVLDTVRATLLANLEPICAIAIAYLVLGEVLTPPQLIGAAVVIGAVLVPSLAPAIVRKP